MYELHVLVLMGCFPEKNVKRKFDTGDDIKRFNKNIKKGLCHNCHQPVRGEPFEMTPKERLPFPTEQRLYSCSCVVYRSGFIAMLKEWQLLAPALGLECIWGSIERKMMEV